MMENYQKIFNVVNKGFYRLEGRTKEVEPGVWKYAYLIGTPEAVMGLNFNEHENENRESYSSDIEARRMCLMAMFISLEKLDAIKGEFLEVIKEFFHGTNEVQGEQLIFTLFTLQKTDATLLKTM